MDELPRLFQALKDVGLVDRKCHGLHALQSHGADAVVGDHLSDAVEADFLFKVIGIDHCGENLGAKVAIFPKMIIFAAKSEVMKIGQMVNISPYLTHLNDWIMGEVIEVEQNPYRGTVIAAKDNLGRIFWGEIDYFKTVNEAELCLQ